MKVQINKNLFKVTYEGKEGYIITDENIEVKGLCFNTFDNCIWEYMPVPCPMPYWGNKKTLLKIIAASFPLAIYHSLLLRMM